MGTCLTCCPVGGILIILGNARVWYVYIVETTEEAISFLGILLAVQLESFLWGFGTALGELPPYFVAKKAADTNE